MLGHKIELLTGTAGPSPPAPLGAALATRYFWSCSWSRVRSEVLRGFRFEQEEGFCEYQLIPSFCAAGSRAEPSLGRGLGRCLARLCSLSPGVLVVEQLGGRARVKGGAPGVSD